MWRRGVAGCLLGKVAEAQKGGVWRVVLVEAQKGEEWRAVPVVARQGAVWTAALAEGIRRLAQEGGNSSQIGCSPASQTHQEAAEWLWLEPAGARWPVGG